MAVRPGANRAMQVVGLAMVLPALPITQRQIGEKFHRLWFTGSDHGDGDNRSRRLSLAIAGFVAKAVAGGSTAIMYVGERAVGLERQCAVLWRFH